MTLGKVVGTVVATQKDEKLTGGKLLVVQEMGLGGEMLERYAVAVDSVGAGLHEVVLVAMGSSARLTVATWMPNWSATSAIGSGLSASGP